MSLVTRWLERIASRRTTTVKRPSEPQRDATGKKAPARSYEAVAIRVHGPACREARRLAGKRFLVAEAPKLPLHSCNVHCTCTYKTYPDRRLETRRSADVGLSSTWYVGPERRSGLDRRISERGGNDGNYYDYMRRRGKN